MAPDIPGKINLRRFKKLEIFKIFKNIELYIHVLIRQFPIFFENSDIVNNCLIHFNALYFLGKVELHSG